MILSSHLKGYVDSINIEAVSAVNNAGIDSVELSESLRLLHSRAPLETIAETGWDRPARATHIAEFVAGDGWLWTTGTAGVLDPDRLLNWMSAPTPHNLRRYYRYWGIADIFSQITRAAHTRDELWVRLQELVDKRNSIAHGDLATTATTAEVRTYLRAVDRFAHRADGVLARIVARLCGTAAPW